MEDTIYIIVFFIFGCVFGSFFAVIGERLPKGENFTTSSSHCNTCNHKLGFFDMIPVITYLLNKGKCKYCKASIPVLLPIVELLTGLLASVSYYSFGFSYDILIAFGVIAIFMIVLVSDLNYYIIPDEVLIFFIFYFIILQYLKGGINLMSTRVVTGVFLFLLMYFIMILGEKIFKRESLGGGDVKLMFIFGLVLEPILGVLSIFIASVIALIPSLYILLKNKDHMIPFGPFLIISFAALYFSKINTLDFLRFLGF